MNATDESPSDAPGARLAQPAGRPLASSRGTQSPPTTIDAAELFGGQSEVRLLHRGQEYRLRVTKQGKLILTK